MKKIIVLFFLFITNSSFSQTVVAPPLLRYTEQQIRSEYNNTEFTTDHLQNGMKYMVSKTDLTETTYYFGSNNLTFMCTVHPLTQDELNHIIQYYNNTAVIVSENKWKLYSNTSTTPINIKFEYVSGVSTFYYDDSQ